MTRIYQLLILATLISCGSNNMLKEIKKLDHYPSASGIEYFRNHFYIIGDDANNLLILDEAFNSKDSIQLYSFSEKRIPKAIKPDLEAITVTKDSKLLIVGSGSLTPTRNIAWIVDPVTKQKDSTRLDIFYQRLTLNGLKEINIEGICSIPGSVVFSNRGSKGYPKNHLIFTNDDFMRDQANAPLTVIPIGANTDSSFFNGVSGLAYSTKSDRLVITISTEDTRNNMDDGAIGKSYLWIVENISSKKGWKAINPDEIIDMDAMDAKFTGQKIESVCITKETASFLHLVLVADNDNGTSSIFRLIVEKK
ncbi:MAG: hypothetical protein V9F01_12515 [Chitinophagaceae bacterium]